MHQPKIFRRGMKRAKQAWKALFCPHYGNCIRWSGRFPRWIYYEPCSACIVEEECRNKAYEKNGLNERFGGA